MNVFNGQSYSNIIYKAVVVNADYNLDPEGKNRVQIYIPNQQPELESIYMEYMNSKDKRNSENMNKFPWAKSLVNNLNNGNVAYVNCIENNAGDFLIIGLEAYNPSNLNSGNFGSNGSQVGSELCVSGSALMDLILPIVMQNEVGIEIKDWYEGITDEQYTLITPDDNGHGWSIGLIQWSRVLAFNVLNYITKKDTNWESYWTDKSCNLFLDLQDGSMNRDNYGDHFKLYPSNKSIYNPVKQMLGSEAGKIGQREYASIELSEHVADLENNYNVHNPAILIWMTDVINQYGSYLPQTKQKCADVCSGGTNDENMMEQLEEVIDYFKQNFTELYWSRRERTWNYIKQLYISGKLTTSILTDLTGANVSGSDVSIIGNGQYCYPFKGSAKVTATWGEGGYHGSGNYHTGIDFGMPIGTPIYAVTSGNVYSIEPSYGLGLCLQADDGNRIYYGHLSEHVRYGQVNKGDLIGYSGNTGHSTGPHLHFEIREAPYRYSDSGNGDDINPFPFLGIQENYELYGEYVDFS